ncbi:MAG: prepilin-type N-terminal cleavage/methylation domain-containing protein [Phycisphaeraceae bacterium]
MSRRPDITGASRAFTLLELILVLVITATLLGIAMVSLQRFHADRRVEDAAAHFMTVAQQARTRAIHEAAVYRLRVDLDAGEYWLTRDGDRLESELGQTFQWDRHVHVTWADPARTGGEVELTFHPDGRSQTVAVLFQGRDHAIAVVRDAISEPMRMRQPTETLLAHHVPPIR